ncbi:MAG: T9SS type A sorting domain-containing protein [Bacteroidota bacterium]
MKTLSISLLLGVLTLSVQAQDFYQQGDHWTYRDFQFAPPWLEGPYSSQIEVVGDTNLQGLNAVMLQINQEIASQVILRSDSQKVWIWRDNAFRLFVDFSLNAGDSMQYYVPYVQNFYEISCGSTPMQNERFQVVIDSVSFLDMNGFSLKQLHTSYVLDTSLHSNWILGTITEGIGSDQGFWGRSETQCLSGFWGNFACYSDLQRGLYIEDTVACFGDTTALPYPAFMLGTDFQWHEINRDINEPNRTDIFYTVGDPVSIDGEIWNPVCQLYTNPFDTVAREFFLRHDSLARQLYYRHSIDSSARILYDYKLSVGSVLDPALYGVYIEPNSYVSAIDTLYFDGRPIRYFELNGDPFGAGLYEGFGSSRGLFFGVGACLCIDNVHSMQIDGQALFDFPTEPMPSNCASFLLSNEADLSKTFSIIQMEDLLEIRTAAQNAQSYQVQMFNLQGQLLSKTTVNPTQAFRLSTAAFPAGVYLLQIKQGQAILNRKILITY